MFYKKLPIVLASIVLLLVGWGCPKNNQTPNVINTTEPITETPTDNLVNESENTTPDTLCPENMTRFWSATKNDFGMTFCYFNTTSDDQKIKINNFGDKVVLYPENNPELNHSILLERLGNGASIEETLAAKYLTTEERADCKVLSEARNTKWTEFIIAGGDLEAQEKCGEFRNGGFFYSKQNEHFIFFITIGQDTFMPSDAWLNTLEVIENSDTSYQTIAPTNNFINGLSTYKNKKLGFSFSYPTGWGPIITDSEMGYLNEDNNFAQPTCEVQQTLELAGVRSGLVMSAHNISGCGPAGRGGWFGDQAQAFTDWDKITEWCNSTGDSCEIFTNQNGLKVAHAYDKEMEIWGDVYQDLDLYALFNPNNQLPGLIISNERLINSGLGRSEKELRQLIDSIKFE